MLGRRPRRRAFAKHSDYVPLIKPNLRGYYSVLQGVSHETDASSSCRVVPCSRAYYYTRLILSLVTWQGSLDVALALICTRVGSDDWCYPEGSPIVVWLCLSICC